MRIGIAGVGGIGSNVAVNLVRNGLDKFRIVDFDRIEKSNLNRQFYFEDQVGQYKVEMLDLNLKRINGCLSIEKSVKKLDAGNIEETFEGCPILVEGFDVEECKTMLIEKFGNSGKLVVSASGIAGGALDSIKTRKFGNCYIVGDFVSDFREHKIYSHKVQTVASMMSAIIMEKGGLYE